MAEYPSSWLAGSRLNWEQSAKVFSKCSMKMRTLWTVGGWQAVRQGLALFAQRKSEDG